MALCLNQEKIPMEEGRGFKGSKTNSTSQWGDRRRAFVQPLFLPEPDHLNGISTSIVLSRQSASRLRTVHWATELQPVMDDVILVAGVNRYEVQGVPQIAGVDHPAANSPLRTAPAVHMSPQLVPNSRALHPIASHLPLPSTTTTNLPH